MISVSKFTSLKGCIDPPQREKEQTEQEHTEKRKFNTNPALDTAWRHANCHTDISDMLVKTFNFFFFQKLSSQQKYFFAFIKLSRSHSCTEVNNSSAYSCKKKDGTVPLLWLRSSRYRAINGLHSFHLRG